MTDFPQSDLRLWRDAWYLTADQQVFSPSRKASPASIVLIVNGLLQTAPGVFAVDASGTVTVDEPCLAGDTVVLRYTLL